MPKSEAEMQWVEVAEYRAELLDATHGRLLRKGHEIATFVWDGHVMSELDADLDEEIRDALETALWALCQEED